MLEKESTACSLEVLELLLQLALRVCAISLRIDSLSLSLHSFIATRNAELASLMKLIRLTTNSSFDSLVLFCYVFCFIDRPFVFYEEEGLSLEKTVVSAFLLMYLRHTM